MSKKFKIFLIVDVILMLILSAGLFIHFQPADFKIARTTNISASAETIFNNVNDLRKWESWSPWKDLDSQAKMEFTGSEAGVGAVMSWSGNSEVGVGKLTITEASPNEYMKYNLDMIEPMASTNVADFVLTSQNNQTTVTWTMSGKNDFMGKACYIIFGCEKMIGEKFEKGLANLKSVSESVK
jgi:hypothetical protein